MEWIGSYGIGRELHDRRLRMTWLMNTWMALDDTSLMGGSTKTLTGSLLGHNLDGKVANCLSHAMRLLEAKVVGYPD